MQLELHQDTVLAFAASLVCLVLIGLSLHRKIAQSKRASQICLLTAAGLALLTFFSFGSPRHYQRSGFVNYHEHFHHYLGSKYFPELGYDGLYAASLAAQKQNRPTATLPRIVRNLLTNEVVPLHTEAVFLRQIKNRFSPHRWGEFRRDHALIMNAATPELRGLLRVDHGYNATPTGTAIARVGTSLISADPLGLGILSLVDILLALVMFSLIGRTYGTRTLCTSLVIFGLGFGWRYMYVGSLMRLDWLVAVISAFCLLERKRPAMAGALLGYATASRIFPALLLAGPFLLALKAWRQRERPTWPIPLFGAFVVTLALAVLLGGLSGRGLTGWSEFAGNILRHLSILPMSRLGLEVALKTDPLELATALAGFTSMPSETHPQVVSGRGLVLPALQLALVALFCLAAWRATLVETAVLGIGLIFVLTTAGSYYWVILLALPLIPGRVAPLVPMLLAVFVYGHQAISGSQELIPERYLALSWALTAFFSLWFAQRAIQTLRSGTGSQSRLAASSAIGSPEHSD